MRLSFAALLLVPVSSFAQEPPPIAPTDAKTPAEELATFKLPAGFAAQLVASEPDIQKPMQCAFDAKGRLWITTSHHYPFPAEEGKGTDKLFILSDFGPDGRAGKVETFAADLNIPIGILPLPDCRSCIVSSVGQILKLTDATGAGKATKTEVLFTGFGTRDTHGMTNSYTLMPDGWVYACHGYLNDSRVKGKDGHEIHIQSGHTFRFRPDGSRIEIFTHGQVNPFGIAIDPWFNLYTADCHTKPITQLIPGGWYDSFGKPHDGLGYAPHVTRHAHGSTALCGLAWYDADHFPKEFLGTLFLGNVVTNRINFDKIEWKGSTPVGIEQPDFLVSGDPWFRPTDIKLGPDGALYVTDFYNKIIGHYEVDLRHPGRDKDRGRVWRIVWTGSGAKPPVNANPIWYAATDAEVAKGILSPNGTTRLQAANELSVRLKKDKKYDLTDISNDLLARAGNLAAASRLAGVSFMACEQAGRTEDYATIFKHVAGMSEEDRRTLTGMSVRALGSRTEWKAEDRQLVLDCLTQFPTSIRVRRAVVEALASHPHADNVKPLLVLIPTIPAEDTHLKYAARLALRNSLQKVGDWSKADFPAIEPVVADVALGIPTEQAARFVANAFQARATPRDRVFEAAEFIGRYGDGNSWELVPRTRLATDLETIRAYEAMLRGVQAAGRKDNTRDSIFYGLNGIFDHVHEGRVAESRAYVAAVKLAAGIVNQERYGKTFADKCRNWIRTSTDASLRTEALEALALYDRAAALELARTQFTDPTAPAALQERAATLLAGSRATVDQALLTDAFKTAPYKLSQTIATGLARDRVGADLLFAAVKAGQASPRLLQEKTVLDALKAARVTNADARVVELTKGLPSPDVRLAGIIKDRTAGYAKATPDATAGKLLFTKHCATCHQIANEGGKIAPNLDGIGARGLDRLLEDVLDPNRNVDANFRATRFDTTDGRAITGLLRQQDGDVYVVADSEGKEIRLPRGVVDKITPLATSPMPADVAEKLKEKEIYDLMGYLLTQKGK